jgi:hypothetical protein
LAIRTGNLFNQTEISRDTGVSQPTVHRYINLIEASHLIQRIALYHTSRSKRITKMPKAFFSDPALSIYLSGYHDENSLWKARELGNYFETAVLMHVKILAELLGPKASIYFWRGTSAKEVDFVLEQGKKVIALEVKYSRNPTFNDIKNLLAFLEENPRAIRGILLHAGSSIKWLHSKVIAVPW